MEQATFSWDKKKRQNIYFEVYICRLGGGEGKVFGQCEDRKQFLIHDVQNNCIQHILHVYPLYLLTLKLKTRNLTVGISIKYFNWYFIEPMFAAQSTNP